MAPLPSDLRGLLERAVINARGTAEEAARDALDILAVERNEPYTTMSESQRQLRRALRARARQLGGGSQSAGMGLLVEEIAYAQWHRMLFARFLAENNLLMHPEGVAVTLEECAELAPEENEPDAWALAARYAGAMLPGIFRPTDPTAQVRFAPEGRAALERLIGELPPLVFTADDALGWVYQFWQSKKKDEVNKSGRKIGGADISPVTQLFTEHYMVQFLLENSLGAWWAARHPQSPLVKTFSYLRFRDDGTPAAGSFPGWPERAAEITMMDPCCGSGHFLVAAFDMLRRVRMEEEGLSEAAAADAVLRDNIHGLELDPRCTQIATFALAFAAWKAGGYRTLPALNIACSGIPVQGQLGDWTKLAGDDDRLRGGLERLYQLFKNAPDLGSLINPTDLPLQDRMFTADYAEVEPLLHKALVKEHSNDPAAAVLGAAAEGVATAARLLAGKYTLVTTNVPYLARGKQSDNIKDFCERNYSSTKADIATVFVVRCKDFCAIGGTYALVTPQNWLSLVTYSEMRQHILKEQSVNFMTRLGSGAFETISGEIVNTILIIATNQLSEEDNIITVLDLNSIIGFSSKRREIIKGKVYEIFQFSQLRNPGSRITLTEANDGEMLEVYASSIKGLTTGDENRLIRRFWETPGNLPGWSRFQSTVTQSTYYGGRESLFYWCDGKGPMQQLPGARTYAQGAWGKLGVLVSQMGNLPVTLYTGDAHDNNTAVIVPKYRQHLPAIWAFCTSAEFNTAVRQIDTALKVTNATLVKVSFDLERWQKVADEMGPLPQPHSYDPTQWLFRGYPAGSTEPLQVAIGRLLAYGWPEQEHDGLDRFADTDGIVCLPPVAGEHPAEERLRTLLSAAYGEQWTPLLQDKLLADAGSPGKDLATWLRDDFFKQHCGLFHNRPFIWHIWDGRKDGFSALVNYHKLDAARLDRLIYTYLGTWIEAQRHQRDAGVAGSDGRLVAALELQQKLQAIRDGEPPYDIYVRWKPLHEQPIGWHPDLNDGVRLNIRPFVNAGVLRTKFTIHWNKDRGTNPDGSERLNDLHYTNEEKRKAREQAQR